MGAEAMTLDEWTDIVARMTPRQREAMAYAMDAIGPDMHATGHDLRVALRKPLCGHHPLNNLYPAAVADGGGA